MNVWFLEKADQNTIKTKVTKRVQIMTKKNPFFGIFMHLEPPLTQPVLLLGVHGLQEDTNNVRKKACLHEESFPSKSLSKAFFDNIFAPVNLYQILSRTLIEKKFCN